MVKTQKEVIEQVGEEITLRVAGSSIVKKVAGAATKYMDEGFKVSLLAIGAGAVNQALKAVCVARGIAAPKGKDLMIVPGFCDEKFEDETFKTAIKITFYER